MSPSQESFFKRLTDGDLPQPYADQYAHFRSHVMSDHLILLVFSCGCRRFIECTAKYRGRGAATAMVIPGMNIEWTMSYVFPKTKVDCGTNVLDVEWARRNLKVFAMRVGYQHHYFDEAFRQHQIKLDNQPKLVNAPPLILPQSLN